MTWKAYIDVSPWEGSARLFVRENDNNGNGRSVRPLETVDVRPGGQVDPCMSGEDRDVRGFCEAIAEAAWHHGWRPANFKDHTNELTATKSHLEDMRKISFAAVQSKFPMSGGKD